MSYTPTASDLHALGYVPSHEDLAVLTAPHYADTPGNRLTRAIAEHQPHALAEMEQSPVVKGITGGVLGAGDALRNTLADIANVVPGVHIPTVHSGSGLPYDIGSVAGNVGGFLAGGEGLEAARAGAEAVPYLGKIAEGLGGAGGRAVARRAAGTAALGAATDPQDRLRGAALGGALGGLPIEEVAIPKGKEFLSRFAAPGISKLLSKALARIHGSSDQDLFDRGEANYADHKAGETKSWDHVTDVSQMADKGAVDPKGKSTFDNSDYLSTLKNRLNELKSQSADQSAMARTNAPAEKLLEGYINKSKHGTFSDAIVHNKALNQDYKNELEPNVSVPFNTVNFAKAALGETLAKNIASHNLEGSLGDAWADANARTAAKNKIFNEKIQPGGGVGQSSFSQFRKGKTPFADPSSFISDYLPKGAQSGTQKLQQLSQIVGSPEHAKDAILRNIFKKTFNPDGSINAKSFMNKYNTLSPEQRASYFTPAQHQHIQSLSSILTKHPDILNHRNWMSSVFHESIPAALGAGAGALMGMSPWHGGLAGAAGSVLGAGALKRAFESPKVASYWSDYLAKDPAAVEAHIAHSPVTQAVRSALLSTLHSSNPLTQEE